MRRYRSLGFSSYYFPLSLSISLSHSLGPVCVWHTQPHTHSSTRMDLQTQAGIHKHTHTNTHLQHIWGSKHNSAVCLWSSRRMAWRPPVSDSISPQFHPAVPDARPLFNAPECREWGEALLVCPLYHTHIYNPVEGWCWLTHHAFVFPCLP